MMKKICILLFAFIILLFSCNSEKQVNHKLRISEANPHLLINEKGNPVLLIGEAAWRLPFLLSREDAEVYVKARKKQKYNLISINTTPFSNVNFYGDSVFERKNGKINPLKPITTKGNNPEDSIEYDYWDHLDYIVDLVDSNDMYISITLTLASFITGSNKIKDTARIVFNEENGYWFANWIANRFKDKKHIIWFLGGDRTPFYEIDDYREVFRAMAEGLADGTNGINAHDGEADYSTTLITYHPQKDYAHSSAFFHFEEWQDINSIQACPREQANLVTHDYNLQPTKPTWVMEGRYEGYKSMVWWDWQIRFQAYTGVLAGGIGHIYGHEFVWRFSNEWKDSLNAKGGTQMQYLSELFNEHITPEEFINLVPDQSMVKDANAYIAITCWPSDTTYLPKSFQIQVLRSKAKDMLLCYAANGRNIEVYLNKLKVKTVNSYWFNPRNGKWFDGKKEYPIQTAKSKGIKCNVEKHLFDPPGVEDDGNDWVLLLK